MGETFGGGIDRQHEAALGTRLTFVRENHELARHELAAVIVAHGAGDEQQLAFLDLALQERLTRPGTLERATAAVVAEDRPEYPESLAGGEHPRAHDAADARRLLAHLHLVQGRERRGVEIPMGGVVQQVPDAPDTEPCERLRTLRPHALQVLHRCSELEGHPPMSLRANRSAANTSRSPRPSPVPRKRIGTCTARSSATTLPPFAVPSSFVTISPVSGTAAAKARAWCTAFCPTVASSTSNDSCGAPGCRRAAPHGRAPARGVEEGGARRRQAAAGRAARVVARARRHGGTERGAPGPRLRGRGAAHRADRDEARRHREGRERGGARARGASPDPLSRHGRGPRRSRGVRRGTVRAEAHRRVTLQLRTSVKYLKGVGPKRAEALARLGIRSVGDLLYHAPHRYLDATTVTPLHKVQVGQEATCVGRVVSTGVLPTRKGLRVFRAVLRDDSGGGPLECAWPGQPFLERQIKKGQLLLVTGPVRYYHGRQLVPREFVILADEGEAGPERGLVLPVYPATEGLTHRQVRGLIHQHLDALLALVADPHPKSLRVAVGLRELGPALGAVHRPEALADAEAGRRRLAFDELFDQQLVQARARALAKRARAGITFTLKKAFTTKLKQHLPFALTGDQRQAIREIADDMLAPLRMHRLLMGDVGTGKTVVALFAMLLAVENDYQAAIMAPTG